MSIATELQDLNDNILDAYTAIGNKGGTVPAQKNTANLDTAIGSIPAAPETYIPLEVESGILRKSGETSTWSAPNTATSIDKYGLAYAFYNCINLTSVDLSSITSIGDYGMQFAFGYCSDLSSVDLRSVSSIGLGGLQTAFKDCISLTSVDLSNLAVVDSDGLVTAFRGCTSLTTMSFDNVSSIGPHGFQSAFNICSNLTTVSFPALTTSSFGTSTNQFDGMLLGCTGVTVHFPAAIASTIGPWSSVRNGFGGTNTTVLFDL